MQAAAHITGTTFHIIICYVCTFWFSKKLCSPFERTMYDKWWPILRLAAVRLALGSPGKEGRFRGRNFSTWKPVNRKFGVLFGK